MESVRPAVLANCSGRSRVRMRSFRDSSSMNKKPPIKDDYRRSLLYVASRTNTLEAGMAALVVAGCAVVFCLHSCCCSP